MDNLILSFNAVMPMFLIIALGAWFKGIFSEKTAAQINRAVYLFFIPVLLFNNIYHADLTQVIRPKLIFFIIGTILCIWLFSLVVTLIAEKSTATRGAMIQCMFRSNYTILGIPIVSSLFGPSEAGITSLLVAVIVPVYNLLATGTLEIFCGTGVQLRKVLYGIIKNPLIIGTAAGIFALLLDVRLPVFLETTIGSLSSAAVPLALVTIGASFKFHKIKENRKNLIISVFVKTMLTPLVLLPLSVFLGFRNVELATLMVVFAAPTALASYPMAVEMNSNGDLTSEAIIFSTLVSCPAIILYAFILKEFGFI